MTERKEEEKRKRPCQQLTGAYVPEELTQTQLENQHFSFAGKSEIDIQAHTVRLFSESRGDFAHVQIPRYGLFQSAPPAFALLLRGLQTRGCKTRCSRSCP